MLEPGDVEDRLVGRDGLRDRDGSPGSVAMIHRHRPPDTPASGCSTTKPVRFVTRSRSGPSSASTEGGHRPSPRCGDRCAALRHPARSAPRRQRRSAGRLADVEPGEDRGRRSPVGVAHEESDATQDLDAAETDSPQRGPVEQGGKRAGDELARLTGGLQGAVDRQALGVGHPAGQWFGVTARPVAAAS